MYLRFIICQCHEIKEIPTATLKGDPCYLFETLGYRSGFKQFDKIFLRKEMVNLSINVTGIYDNDLSKIKTSRPMIGISLISVPDGYTN